MKLFALSCLLMLACHCSHSSYPTLYTDDGMIHLGCDAPAQCRSQAKQECPWGYSILSHSSNPRQLGYYSVVIKCQ